MMCSILLWNTEKSFLEFPSLTMFDKMDILFLKYSLLASSVRKLKTYRKSIIFKILNNVIL